MAWSDLDWPNLSPRFPEPRPQTLAAARPDVPTAIAEQVRRAERRRGRFVPLCILAGALLAGAGLALAAAAPRAPRAPIGALLLIALGMLVATLLPALAVLLVIGPSWTQRQQHLRLLLWERERAGWLARERARYVAALPPERREALSRALRA
ncbi:MAG: hypothetical protein ACHQ4H_09435 [Ktedonobacterales bacterium]